MDDHEPPKNPTSSIEKLPYNLLNNNNTGINQLNNSHLQVKCVISNRHGEKLVGIMHDAGSKELVIVCHGIKSTKDRIPMVNIASALAKIDISAFRFDFAGNGESEGSFLYGNYRREAEDLRAVIEHFRRAGLVINTIIGHSKGGNVVLLYAAKYHDVYRVVNISGRFDLKKGMEGRLGKDFLNRLEKTGYIDVINKSGKLKYRVTKECIVDRLSTDIRAACHLIPENCRVLTIHGSMDQIVPVEDAVEFDKVVANHVLRIIEGADHEYTLHQNELVQVVLGFISDQNQGHDTTKHSSAHGGNFSSIRPRM